MKTSIALLAAVVLVGCKKTPPCHGDLTADDQFELSKRIKAGENVCPELALPKVAVDASGISLNGAKIAGPEALTGDKVRRIDALFEPLRSDREIWKLLHAGGTQFAGTIDFEIAPEVGFVGAASALLTAAFCGSPNVHLHSGDVTLDIACAVPEPPRADGTHPAPATPVTMHGSKGSFHDAAKRAVPELTAAPGRKVAFEVGADN